MSETLEEVAHRAEEAERKGVQLCNAVGAMMLACKRLGSLQKAHADVSDVPCPCPACRIPLPDLSDEFIEELTNKSNAQAAVRKAAREWRDAVRNGKAAVKRIGSSGQECFELGKLRDEKEAALCAAIDSLPKSEG